MKAMLLAAGYGSRLGEIVTFCPKKIYLERALNYLNLIITVL